MFIFSMYLSSSENKSSNLLLFFPPADCALEAVEVGRTYMSSDPICSSSLAVGTYFWMNLVVGRLASSRLLAWQGGKTNGKIEQKVEKIVATTLTLAK